MTISRGLLAAVAGLLVLATTASAATFAGQRRYELDALVKVGRGDSFLPVGAVLVLDRSRQVRRLHVTFACLRTRRPRRHEILVAELPLGRDGLPDRAIVPTRLGRRTLRVDATLPFMLPHDGEPLGHVRVRLDVLLYPRRSRSGDYGRGRLRVIHRRGRGRCDSGTLRLRVDRPRRDPDPRRAAGPERSAATGVGSGALSG